MRFSILATTALAGLVIASPLKAIAKKEYVYDITTEVVYVTITMEAPATSSSSSTRRGRKQKTKISTVKVLTTVVVAPTEAPVSVAAVPTSTSVVIPEFVPTTSSVVVVVPEPTTVAPVVVVVPETTSTTPVPEPTTTAVPEVTTTAPAAVDVVVAQNVATSAPVAGSAAAPASATKPTDYQGLALWHHNKHRANHSSNGLTWSSDLAARALVTANTCVFAHDMYVGGGGYGQNLAAYGSTNLGAASNEGAVADAITNQWYYGETANMPYGVDSPDVNGPEFLHLSAMLWKGSDTVGCATVTCAKGTVFSTMPALYTVCDYQTTGNILGAFASNVLKPIGNAGITASATG